MCVLFMYICCIEFILCVFYSYTYGVLSLYCVCFIHVHMLY